MAGPSTQAHLDVLARQQGFKDYATWAAYQRTRNGIIGAGGATGIANPNGAQPTNWLQNLLSRIPMTPAFLLGHVNDKMNQATGGQ